MAPGTEIEAARRAAHSPVGRGIGAACSRRKPERQRARRIMRLSRGQSRRQNAQQANAAQQPQIAATQQRQATFAKAHAACLEGRGDTVKSFLSRARKRRTPLFATTTRK
jgi:hypothetical protein